VGVEPAENLAVMAREDGVDTINDFFNEGVVDSILNMKGKADVVTANNVFAHVADIKTLTHSVKRLLKKDGVFCIEVQYLADAVQKSTFDNIYHEHLSYFTVLSLNEFFKRQGMNIFKVESIETHGGSIRVFIQTNESTHPIDTSVEKFIEYEKSLRMDDIKTYEDFADKIYSIRDGLQKFVKKLKSEGKTIVGYGAPAKATTLLNFCGIDSSYIDYIVEDNPLKKGYMVPGVRIPIMGKEEIEKTGPDYIAILAWNFADEILKKNQSYSQRGGKFIIPLPIPSII
jgi:hypothetical protein